MNKTRLFIKLYYRQKIKFLIMVIIFALTGMVISCSLFIRENNENFYEAQLVILEENSVSEDDREEIQIMREEASRKEGSFVTNSVSNILSVFAFVSILTGIWGCASLLFFQNTAMQKSFVMLKVFGIQRKDLVYKALTDGLSYGFFGGLAGSTGGFYLFKYLSARLCKLNNTFSILSIESLKTLLLTTLMLFVIAFSVSLVSCLYLYEKPVITVLYERNTEKEKQIYWKVALVMAVFMYSVICIVFRKTLFYINILFIICITVILLLTGIFYIIFKSQAQKRNNKVKTLNSIYGISRCFLCTRNKRDAFLAASVSAGAIIICFILNIEFNFSGILRDSYRDKQGYSTVVSLQGFNNLNEIESLLNNNGYKYTLLYNKWVEYKELNNVRKDTKKDKYTGFFAALFVKQTDDNINFQIPKGSFAAENYFVYRCGLELGKEYNIFGGNTVYSSNLDGNKQNMALARYNCIINLEDWHLGTDNTWSSLFLLDLSRQKEENLKKLLLNVQCNVETASQLTDEINKIMSDYISVILVAGFMLILVTTTFFYSMVQSDLAARKKELYLYQLYGASRKKAFRVVYFEYLLTAWIASFSVVCVTMFLGSCFFRFMLNRHYPLSVPVVLVTSFISSLFVLLCCFAAQWVNSIGTKTEIIRDE